MSKIFLVGEHGAALELLVCALGSAGFLTADFEGESDFFEALLSESPDLILLDGRLCALPEGKSLFSRLQKQSPGLPILFLGGEDTVLASMQRLFPLADCKQVQASPVSDLIDCIRTILQERGGAEWTATLPIWCNLEQKDDALLPGQCAVPLTNKEFALFSYLLQYKGVALSRQKLLNKIWGYHYAGQCRTVDTHIKTLRRKLKSGVHIETVRGTGYRLDA